MNSLENGEIEIVVKEKVIQKGRFSGSAVGDTAPSVKLAKSP
jgi:hypothetical protein